MHFRDNRPNLRTTLSLALVGVLGFTACSSADKHNASAVSPESIIESVGKADTAIILSGLKKCPTIHGTAEVSEESHPSIDIAQTYVGSPREVDAFGNSLSLHAALVTNEYTVEDNKNKAVYCGTDNGANGAPFEGVMIVAASASDLIVDTNK
jgi:hypothetical protein